MKRIIRAMATALLLMTGANTASAQDVLFYNGDEVSPGWAFYSLIAEDDPEVSILAYDNFLVSGGPWSVSGLFGQLFSELPFTTLFWEIRSGMSEGQGGVSVANGIANPTTQFKRDGMLGGTTPMSVWDTHVDITAANLILDPGMYWLTLAPYQPINWIDGAGYLRAAGLISTNGVNAVNPTVDQVAYTTSEYFGYDYLLGQPYDYSIGVIGSTVPEPATLTLLATGLVGLASARRRKRARG